MVSFKRMTYAIFIMETAGVSVTSSRKGLLRVMFLGVVLGLTLCSSLTGHLAWGPDVGVASASGGTGGMLQINTINSSLGLSLDDLAAMPKTLVFADLYCYGQLLQSGEWGGVRLAFLLEGAGLDAQAASVQFYAVDGYTVSLSMDLALADNVILAYEKDGLPLPETLRLVVPGANGAMWISMVTMISVVNSIDPRSPNPYPASLIQELLPTLQPSPTPTPVPTPEPSNQSAAQPAVPPPTGQPDLPQQNSSEASLPMAFGYSTLLCAIIAATAVVAGYLFCRRRM